MKKNWLSEHIVGIIALAFTIFTFTVYTIILLRQVKTTETTTTIILNSITNMELLILGYYFVSSKSSKEKDKTISDLMHKPTNVENIENVEIKESNDN